MMMKIVLIVMCLGLSFTAIASAQKTPELMAAEAVVKSIKKAKETEKLIVRKKNGYTKIRNRKKLKRACKKVKTNIEFHKSSVRMYTRMYRTMMKGGRLGRIMAKQYVGFVTLNLSAVKTILPTHVRCLAASKWVSVYINVTIQGKSIILRARRWSRRDRLRIRRAVKPHATKLGIDSVTMVDASGRRRGRHRF